MSPEPIADTGLIVGLLNPHDQHHEWATDQVRQRPKGFVTCEAVISEAIYLVRKSARAKHAVIAMIESGWLRVHPVLPEMRVAVSRILESYHPNADYADACCVALHEQTGGHVWTTDKRDFSIYRTRAGLPVPSIIP